MAGPRSLAPLGGRHRRRGQGEPAILPVPVPGERRVTDRSQQYLTGRLRTTVKRSGRVWWSGESTLAGLERWL